MLQLGLPPLASVKRTGSFLLAASERATRKPLMIDSVVDRISLLRMKSLNDGAPIVNNKAATVSPIMSSIIVNPAVTRRCT